MLRDKIDVKYRVAQLQLDVSRPSFLSRLKVSNVKVITIDMILFVKMSQMY